MTWASTIKDNPVPVKYTLTPIANLFTARHMASLNVNFEQISKNLNLFLHDYCKYLQKKDFLIVVNMNLCKLSLSRRDYGFTIRQYKYIFSQTAYMNALKPQTALQ
jgi:hypothetical protein